MTVEPRIIDVEGYAQGAANKIFFEVDQGSTPQVRVTIYDTAGGSPSDLTGRTVSFLGDPFPAITGVVASPTSGVAVFQFEEADSNFTGIQAVNIRVDWTDGTPRHSVVAFGSMRGRKSAGVVDPNNIPAIYLPAESAEATIPENLTLATLDLDTDGAGTGANVLRIRENVATAPVTRATLTDLGAFTAPVIAASYPGGSFRFGGAYLINLLPGAVLVKLGGGDWDAICFHSPAALMQQVINSTSPGETIAVEKANIVFASHTGALTIDLTAKWVTSIMGPIVFKDASANAGTFPITITVASGTIEGGASITINSDRGYVSLASDGTNTHAIG